MGVIQNFVSLFEKFKGNSMGNENIYEHSVCIWEFTGSSKTNTFGGPGFLELTFLVFFSIHLLFSCYEQCVFVILSCILLNYNVTFTCIWGLVLHIIETLTCHPNHVDKFYSMEDLNYYFCRDIDLLLIVAID